MKKNIIKITLISLFAVVISLLFNNKVYAASASLSAGKTTIEPGETTSISASISSTETWQLDLKTSGGNLSGTTSSIDAAGEEVSKKVISATFSSNVEGTYTITLSGEIAGSDLTAPVSVSKKISITVKKKEVVLSNVAELSTLGITPKEYDTFKFSTKQSSYNVTVPKSVETITIKAAALKNGKVSGIGQKKLNIGANKFDVKVTAEDGKVTKTYTLNVTRESVSKVATLKNLAITPKEYDFKGFKASTTSYDIMVPTSLDKITISAQATDSKATVEGTGEKTLKDGDSKLEIKVTAEDKKTTKTYVLNVKRQETTTTTTEEYEDKKEGESTDEEKLKDGLTNLYISGYTLSPEFSQDIYSYEVSVDKDLTEEDIVTETSGEDIEIEKAIDENGELATILVRNTKTNEVATYQINVKKLEVATEEKKSSASKKELIFISIGILAAIILIIMIIKKIKARNEEEYEYEYEDEDENESQNINNSLEYYKEQERLEAEEEMRERKPKKGKRFK